MVGNSPLIVILGPTAVGKTTVAIELASALNGEIIGADSRQVYRYMDIGTAKPTPLQQATIPHHLIDIVEPNENLSLAQYQEMAYQTIESIHKAGKIPLLVGGTGQYITAIVEGWSIPRVAPNYALRETLETFARTHGNQALYAELVSVDAKAAEKIHPNNVRRIIRALEVYRETGVPFSTLQRKVPPPYRICVYGLTMEREFLYRQADQRIDHMIAEGFIDEVQSLLDRGYHRNLPSMSGLGYAELCQYLLDSVSLEQAIEMTKFATHDFIRRQYVWFRGHDHGIVWHNVEALDIYDMTKTIQSWIQG